MRWLSRRARRDERGAVVVVTAAFAVAMVAMAALVVDVGALHDERAQLQNGADAAALAVAHSCALGTCDSTLAAGLANANARDGATKVDSVTASVASRKVTVATSTKSSKGGTILPYFFARAVTGSPGQTVHAKATASWSGISKADAIPLVIRLRVGRGDQRRHDLQHHVHRAGQRDPVPYRGTGGVRLRGPRRAGLRR